MCVLLVQHKITVNVFIVRSVKLVLPGTVLHVCAYNVLLEHIGIRIIASRILKTVPLEHIGTDFHVYQIQQPALMGLNGMENVANHQHCNVVTDITSTGNSALTFRSNAKVICSGRTINAYRWISNAHLVLF